MELKPGTFCPLLKEECIQFKCAFWTHVRGKHPQTSQELDEYDCAVKWLPVLLIEGAQQTRQAGAAIESLRNHVAGQQDVMNRVGTILGSPVVGVRQLPAQKADDGHGRG